MEGKVDIISKIGEKGAKAAVWETYKVKISLLSSKMHRIVKINKEK